MLELQDCITIKIPGAGPQMGNGYGWVTVESIEKNIEQSVDESFGTRLRSCINPGKGDEAAAHFLIKMPPQHF